ncbi:MAG: hypothetical protein M0T76_00220 [Desulfobacteraceae bacterium]|nr:hypothetical protein [Desulfobacteraceae bacterium]
MAAPRASERILWYENLGFLALILLFWANELLDLPRLLFGGKTRMNWREAALESLLTLAVWLVVHLLTRRLLARLHYLERFLKVCAWCRKIGEGDDWLPMEQYFLRKFDTKTSHGICPDCAEKMLGQGGDGERSDPGGNQRL